MVATEHDTHICRLHHVGVTISGFAGDSNQSREGVLPFLDIAFGMKVAITNSGAGGARDVEGIDESVTAW